MIATESIGTNLIELIKEKSMLKHPFYQKWTNGELSKEALKEYSKQYYAFMSRFPQFLSAIHSNSDNLEIRKIVMENLADEEGFKSGVPSHPLLWEQFAKGLGVTLEEMQNTDYLPETMELVNGFSEAARSGNAINALAMLFAYESQIPEVATSKINGLEKFYNITDPKVYEYFTVHQTADVQHASQELEMIVNNTTSNAAQAEVLESVNKSLDLVWNFLSGIDNKYCQN